MKRWIIKLLVMLPVVVVTLFYLSFLYREQYDHSSTRRIAGLVLLVLLLYCWLLLVTILRKQENFLQVFILSSFFIYVFAVLQLTGYFILFKEISSHDWLDKMQHRIDTNDHLNFTPFKTINIYDRYDKQVLGNFVMLLPLGIYLPLLYRSLRKMSGFFAVLFISFLVSVGIEILQLATNYRSTDVDDVILNTLGGCSGFLIYQVLKLIVGIRITH